MHSTQPPGVTKWGDYGPERARHLPKITQQASGGAGTNIMPFNPSSVLSAQGSLSHPSLLARPPLGAWTQPHSSHSTVSAPDPPGGVLLGGEQALQLDDVELPLKDAVAEGDLGRERQRRGGRVEGCSMGTPQGGRTGGKQEGTGGNLRAQRACLCA